MSASIQIENLSKSYKHHLKRKKVLNECSFEIQEGITALIGECGCGKTTLIHILCAFEKPDEGLVRMHSVSLHALSKKECLNFRRRHIGMIYQSSHLISSLSVYENIRMPLDLEQNSVFDEPFFQAIVQTLQIEHFLELYPNQLSQGQKQKVCIARALITKPEILLADEPTAHLDNESVQEFILLLKKVQILFARTIFMATHDFSLAKQADRILYMKDGKVCPYEIS